MEKRMCSTGYVHESIWPSDCLTSNEVDRMTRSNTTAMGRLGSRELWEKQSKCVELLQNYAGSLLTIKYLVLNILFKIENLQSRQSWLCFEVWKHFRTATQLWTLPWVEGHWRLWVEGHVGGRRGLVGWEAPATCTLSTDRGCQLSADSGESTVESPWTVLPDCMKFVQKISYKGKICAIFCWNHLLILIGQFT